MRKIVVFVVVISGLLCADALADQVTLKNGDRLTGTITKSDGESLSMKSEFAGEVKIQWAAVEEISSNQPLYVTLKDGQVIVGTVTTSGGKIEIQTQDAGKVTTSKAAIQLIRSREEQAAYQAEIDRKLNPKLGDLWSGTADAGLSLTRGNADTLTISLGTQAARTTPRDKWSVYAAALLAKNRTNGISLTTASAIRGGVRYDFNLSKRLFAFALADLDHDKFQNLDLRLVLGGGLGFHAKKTERTTLDIFGGGTFNQEFFSTGLTRRSAEGLVGEELSHKLSKTIALTERAAFYPNLSDLGEYRLTFDSSVVTRLSKLLGYQITLSDRFQSNPLPGIKKNDLLLTTGIRLTFGGNKTK